MCNYDTHLKTSVNHLSAFLANILNLKLNVEIKESRITEMQMEILLGLN